MLVFLLAGIYANDIVTHFLPGTFFHIFNGLMPFAVGPFFFASTHWRFWVPTDFPFVLLVNPSLERIVLSLETIFWSGLRCFWCHHCCWYVQRWTKWHSTSMFTLHWLLCSSRMCGCWTTGWPESCATLKISKYLQNQMISDKTCLVKLQVYYVGYKLW